MKNCQNNQLQIMNLNFDQLQFKFLSKVNI